MSGLRGIARAGKPDDGPPEEAEREDAFQRRTRSQQHIRQHGPLLRALIRVAGDLDLAAHPGEFERRVLQARALAVKVAAGVLDKPASEVTMDEARPWRAECADAVAYAWTSGRPLDGDAFVAELVMVSRAGDASFDADTVPWKLMSAPGSVAMTVVPALMRLRRVVEAYDFRLGSEAVLTRLARVALEASSEAVSAILPPHATVADRRSLLQSVMREYSHDLRAVYEQVARRSLEAMVGMTEDDKVAYLLDVRPLDRVEAAFRGVAKRNTALNAASVAAALGDAMPSTGRVDAAGISP